MALGFIPIATSSTPALAAGPTATVNMPFGGQWAYNANVNPPYTDANSSHPSVHWTNSATNYLWGDWATDLYPPNSSSNPGGTAVKLDVTSPNGTVTFTKAFPNDTCSAYGAGIAGQGITLNVFVNGAPVGQIDYEHLDVINTDSYYNGMTLGTITKEPLNASCYSVRHVHIEFKNAVNSGTHACYTDYGHPGTPLAQGVPVGILGSPNTAIRQACSSVPPTTLKTTSFSVADFNHDGVSDLVKFNAGHWYVKSGASPYNALTQDYVFGGAGDTPLVGDFDGNGYADFVTYNAGVWNVRSGSGSYSPITLGFRLGDANCSPLVGDYNGDHKSDFAVDCAGHWYVFSGVPPYAPLTQDFAFGNPGDIPLVGDFNGDGKSDFVTYNNGIWDVRSGVAPYAALTSYFSLGGTGCSPLVGKFDGDASSDFAVDCTGTWTVRSGVGPTYSYLTQGLQFGSAGATPLTGHFAVNGWNDFAIYEGGTWTVRSGVGPYSYKIQGLVFGGGSDIPITG